MAAVADLSPDEGGSCRCQRRGVKLGGDRGYRLTAKARAMGRAVLQERAQSAIDHLAPTISELRAAVQERIAQPGAGPSRTVLHH
jgi:hypothetical protein